MRSLPYLAALALLIMASIVLLTPGAGAQTDPPASGDWTVSDTTVVRDRIINLYGNLTVTDGGHLTLTNVTLQIHTSTLMDLGIRVLSGGRLVIDDGDGDPNTTDDFSWMYPRQPTRGFFFIAEQGSSLVINRTVINGAGELTVSGGVLVRTNDTFISDTIFNRALEYGLMAEGCTGITLENCTFMASDYGVVLKDCGPSRIERSYVAVNTQAGIWVANCTGIVVDMCLVSPNTFEGIRVEGSSNVSIGRCVVKDNAWGIVIDGSRQVTITNSAVQESLFSLVTITGSSSEVSLQDTRLNETRNHGIDGDAVTNLSIDGCQIFDANFYGIRLINVTGLDLVDTNVSGNGQDGVHMERTDHILIERCEISGNGYNGAFVIGCSNVTVQSSQFVSNGYDGINMDQVDGALFDGIEALSNGHNGLFLQAGSRNVTVKRSNLLDSTGSGACLNSVSAIRIEDSELSGNGYYGLCVEAGSSDVRARRCEVQENGGGDLMVDRSQDIFVHDCALYLPVLDARTVIARSDSQVWVFNSSLKGDVEASTRSNVTIVSPSTEEFNPVLGFQSKVQLEYWVDIIVVWPDGNPVPGAEVYGTQPSSAMAWYWQTDAAGLTALRHIPVKYWTDIMTADCNPWTFQARKGEDISSNQTTITGNTRVVVVLQDSIPPVAVVDDVVAELGARTTLNGERSTDNGVIASWVWTFDDGIGIVVLEGEVVNWTFTRLGTFNATLNVTDGVGLFHELAFNITVVDTTAPQARAGENVTVAQRTMVDLDGTATTDNDPTILGTGRFVWSVYDAGDGDFKGTIEGPFASWRFDDMGVFRVLLEVWDQSLNHGSDDFWVTVLDTEPPHVDAGGDIEANQYVTVPLNRGLVEDNDPDFPETGQVWWRIVGEDLDVNLTEQFTQYVFEVFGEYTATLYALDGSGNLGHDTVNITVLDNEDPVVRAGTDMTVQVGTTVALKDEGTTDNDPSFPDGAVFRWSITGPPDLDISWTGESLNFVVPWVGEYLVELTVTDADGNRGSASFVITGVDDTRPTLASFEPGPDVLLDTGVVTVTAVLEDAGTGLDNSSLKYRWRLATSDEWSDWLVIHVEDGGRTARLEIPLELPDGGTVLELAALDMAGNALDDGEGHLIRVNSRPVAKILSPSEGADFGPYDNILLNASGSYDVDPDDILSFQWHSDVDGSLGAGVWQTVVLSSGTHRITVVVTDGIEGHEVMADVNVTVRPVPSTHSEDEFPWIWVLLVVAVVVLALAVWDARRPRKGPTISAEVEGPEDGKEERDEGEWEPIGGGG